MIFREKVAKKVSTPDDMDILAKITTPVGWITLLTVFVLSSALFVWAFLGEIPITMNGNGILMHSGGMVQVPSPITGIIQQVNVRDGEEVRSGDTIAEVYSAETELAISKLKNDIKVAQNTAEYFKLKSNLDSSLNKINANEQIKAPNDGSIVIMYKNSNEAVREGETVALMTTGTRTDNLHAAVYVPGAAAKRLKEGMTVRMELGNVQSDKYGYLMGKIDKVSAYPVNTQSINKNIGNDTLAAWLIGSGAGGNGTMQPVFYVQVSLFPDAVSKSGYVWTTSAGGPEKLTAGTPLTAFCVVEKKRPAQLVFEWLGTFFGGE